MRRRLIVMRHAKSAWSVDAPDHERPLSTRGKRDARNAATALAQYGPQAMLVSSAHRCTQTADALNAGGLALGVDATDVLYGEDVAHTVDQIRAWAAPLQCGLIVGHYPLILDIVASAAAPDRSLPWQRLTAQFPTSAFAVVDWEGEWATLGDGRARLVRFEVPR